jgi:hypothetical protein
LPKVRATSSGFQSWIPFDANLAREFRGAEFAQKIAGFRFKIYIAASSKSFRATLTPTLSLRERGTMKSPGEGICLSKDKLELLKQPHRSLNLFTASPVRQSDGLVRWRART